VGVQSAVFEIIHESLKDKSRSLTVVALCEILNFLSFLTLIHLFDCQTG